MTIMLKKYFNFKNWSPNLTKKFLKGSYPLFFFKQKTIQQTPLQILNKMENPRRIIAVGNPLVGCPANKPASG